MNQITSTTLTDNHVSADAKDPTQKFADLWTTKEVGKFLHVSGKTVFELRKKGLPYLKLGGAVRFVPQ